MTTARLHNAHPRTCCPGADTLAAAVREPTLQPGGRSKYFPGKTRTCGLADNQHALLILFRGFWSRDDAGVTRMTAQYPGRSLVCQPE